LTTKSDANPEPKRVLVCGASNLSVDNILERLLALPVVDKMKRLKVTRIGHPARVMSQEGILESTLEVKATRTDEVGPADFSQMLPMLTFERQLSHKMSRKN
jgi:DNA polymerase alpha-associated DNA helicase A